MQADVDRISSKYSTHNAVELGMEEPFEKHLLKLRMNVILQESSYYFGLAKRAMEDWEPLMLAVRRLEPSAKHQVKEAMTTGGSQRPDSTTVPGTEGNSS